MEKNLTKIFKNAAQKASPDLTLSIWNKIIIRDKKIAKIKLWIFSLSGLASLVGLIPTFKILTSNLSSSGFYEYFSLIFSNNQSIISFWKELSFSLAESLPKASILLTLSLAFVCFLSLKYLAKQIYENQLSLKLNLLLV